MKLRSYLFGNVKYSRLFVSLIVIPVALFYLLLLLYFVVIPLYSKMNLGIVEKKSKQIDSMQNVKSVDVLTDDYGVQVLVSLLDDSSMRFIYVSPSSFSSTDSLLLKEIDGWKLDTVIIDTRPRGERPGPYGPISLTGGVNIAEDGLFGDVFQFDVHNLSEAIESYEEIKSELDSWPEHQDGDRNIENMVKDGEDEVYYIKRRY